MKDFNGVKVGDILMIVGEGAPGFADIGDKVKVVKILSDPGVEVELLANGHRAQFVYSCGAKRLTKAKVEDSHVT